MVVRRVLFSILVVGALGLAMATSSFAEPPAVTLPESSAVWNGMLKFAIGCTLASGTCTGNATARAPGASASEVLVGGDYAAPAGGTEKLTLDPGGSASKTLEGLERVTVRLTPKPGQGDPIEATLTLVHRESSPESAQHTGKKPPKRRRRRYRRQITLFGGVNPNGKIAWNGRLFVSHGYRPCGNRQPVKIQHRTGSRWVTIARTHTGPLTGEGAAFWKPLPWHPHNEYRVVAPQTRAGRTVCLRAKSRPVNSL